jgi:hypothetical protein
MTRSIRFVTTLLTLTTIVALGACSKDAPKPRTAFEAWLTAVEKCDTVAMRTGLTKTSIEQVEQVVKQLQAFVPEEKRGKFDLLAELCKGYKKGSIVVQEEIVNGAQATLKLTSEGKPIEAPMSLEEGSWKLDFAALMKQSLAATAGARAPTGSTPAAPAPAPAPAPAAAPAP